MNGEKIELPKELTLRDYFAAKALQGFCRRATTTKAVMWNRVKWAYMHADAMITQRGRE